MTALKREQIFAPRYEWRVVTVAGMVPGSIGYNDRESARLDYRLTECMNACAAEGWEPVETTHEPGGVRAHIRFRRERGDG